jgi:hypothetical protein
MGIGPVDAIAMVLRSVSITKDDVDLFEARSDPPLVNVLNIFPPRSMKLLLRSVCIVYVHSALMLER